jgi:hypothetical protein
MRKMRILKITNRRIFIPIAGRGTGQDAGKGKENSREGVMRIVIICYRVIEEERN